MDLLQLPQYIQYLLRPESYPHRPSEVELVQTHISYVLIAGDLVYKWKKPVNFGFLDFSTVERRKYFCEEEVRLNRRLCPEMYLGVAAVAGGEAGFQLDGGGKPLEYCVKMRRLPEERMMNRVIEAGRLGKRHLEGIIDRLVPFYTAADGPGTRGFGSPRAVSKMMHDNFAETSRFIGGAALSAERFAHIRDYAETFLANEELFQRRQDSGHVRECHGDLHAANICLTDRVDIFDCIEFNESLRFTDIAADVAFLAMDLDFHNLRELSEFFIRRFIERSGDRGLPEVLNYYKCYRAYVRGKIGLLTAADPEVGGERAARALADAENYFRLAEGYRIT